MLINNISLIIRKNIFRKTAEELKELDKENNINLSRLLKYLRRRKDKKIKKVGSTD